MLDILPAPDHVAAYRLSGTVNESDFDRMITDVEAKLARHEKLGILADMRDFGEMTFRALLKDAQYELGNLFSLKRFPREAVVTDKGWIETLVSISNALIPYCEIQSFKPADYDKALAWAGGFEGAPGITLSGAETGGSFTPKAM
jgi:hypothetical protein